MPLQQTTLHYANDPFRNQFLQFGVRLLRDLRYVRTVGFVGGAFIKQDSFYMELNPINLQCDNMQCDLAVKEELVEFGNHLLQDNGYMKRLHLELDPWGIHRIRAHWIHPPQENVNNNPGPIFDGEPGGDVVMIFDEFQGGGGHHANDPGHQPPLIVQPLSAYNAVAGEFVDLDHEQPDLNADKRLINVAAMAAFLDTIVQLNPHANAQVDAQELEQRVLHTLQQRYGVETGNLHGTFSNAYLVSTFEGLNHIHGLPGLAKPQFVFANNRMYLH